MLSRVTHQTVMRSTLAHLQQNLGRTADLQAKLSSGKVITKPSDDPSGAADALRLRGDIRATTQYGRNADDGVGWLTAIDSALQSSVNALLRVRNLTVQGASTGVHSEPSREALATEIEGIREELLGLANTTYLGRSVFAGTSNAGVAFDDTGTYQGVPGATVERRVAPDHTIRADADGVGAFGDAASADPDQLSVFVLLDTIVADLRAGNDVSGHLDAIDVRRNAMLRELADVGARHGQMMDAQRTIADSLQSLETRLSGVEDIDLAEVILELQMQEVAYTGALGAAARVLQPSLMDFLR